MKIAFFFDASSNDGGIFHHQIKQSIILNKLEYPNVKFVFVATNKSAQDILKKKNLDVIFYNANLIDRIFSLFYLSDLLKFVLGKFGIQNKFEKFCKEKKIDIIFFAGQSRYSLFCDDVNFTTIIHEIHHLIRPDLPEYKGNNNFDLREKIIDHSTKKAMSVIVDTELTKEEVTKHYRCHKDKVNIIPLSSSLVEKDFNLNEIENEKLKEVLEKKLSFYFYPAQFWPHKNHLYILNALKILKDEYKKEFFFIFCGHKKHNFNFINKKIIEMDLERNVIVLERINESEVITLYKSCEALVWPAYIGALGLPVIEAFYFKTPVFYTKNQIDKKYRKYVNEIDIKDPSSLAKALIEKDNALLNNKVNEANKCFMENFSENNLEKLYKNFLKDLEIKLSIYK